MQFRKVILHSANLKAQRAFYEEKLGLNILKASDGYLEIQVGKSTLTYRYVPDKLNYVYHIAFNIPENQLAAASTWLSERTPLIGKPGNPTETVFHYADWNAHAIYFRDGENNILEFIARHNLDNRAEGTFKGSSLLEVSEVGMPVWDVQQTVATLQARAGILVWRGEGSDMFTALGDEHGLLIMTKVGRPWMEDPTMPLPVTIYADDLEEDFTLDGLPYAFQRAETNKGTPSTSLI